MEERRSQHVEVHSHLQSFPDIIVIEFKVPYSARFIPLKTGSPAYVSAPIALLHGNDLERRTIFSNSNQQING